MALNIKDPESERLAAEVAMLAHESKTEAVRVALRERAERLHAQSRQVQRADRLLGFLQNEVLPQIATGQLGTSVTKADREDILGYGPEGV